MRNFNDSIVKRKDHEKNTYSLGTKKTSGPAEPEK